MKTKLLFLVTEDWYFVSHRLPLAVAAKELGYEVVVATKAGKSVQNIVDAGIRHIPFEISRRGGNPMREIVALIRLYRKEMPDIVHHVALKPVVFGAIAGKFCRRTAQVNAIAGLGWLFTSDRFTLKVLRPMFRRILAYLLSGPNSLCLVQNRDDLLTLQTAGVPLASIRLIPGAGVDTRVFHPVVQPLGSPLRVMLVARMLRDKGVFEFVEAARILSERGLSANFVLVGSPDPANPASISEATLKSWHGVNGLEWWGHREHINEVWKSADIACLPSYREGMPKSLLEAAACGLPIVTTNAPGCREIINDGCEGLLVPVKNPVALADAIGILLADKNKRDAMGKKARERALKVFSQDKIIKATLAVYDEVLCIAESRRGIN